MPPKTLTAEQVAEIDRQQKPAVNMRDVVPQREDVLAARITAQERREAAPAALTPEQADATEAQASVAAMTPFGRAMGAEPDRTTGPVFQPKKRLSAAEADQMQYEQISSPAYMPTKEEFQWYEGYKKTRDDKVSRFVQGATGMAGGLVQAAAATAYAPFDLLVRGTPAWNEWVNSSAEGLRQTSIGLAELWSWGGDIYADNQKELQRSRDLNNQIRQQLAAENKFTGNAQQDNQILEQAIEQAKAGGLYEKTADDLNTDEDTRFERFIRDRSFQQQSANITETNIGTLPDSQREMGIDPSKVNPGLAFTAQLVFDPLNAVVPGGIGALSNLRLMRRTAALTGAPLKGLSKVAKAGADKVEDLYGGILSGIESRTGLNEAAAMGALNNPVTWRAVAAMAALKTTGKVLRKSENWLETGSIIAKEASVGGVGISRADAAARLRNAPIPERYRRAYDGFFTSADSTLRRVSETPGLSPIARRSAATLDRAGVTQAFRLADDAVSGAAAVAPIGIPFAAIAPEDRQPEILGALLSIGAMGGVVGGQARRMSQMNDALVAKMLADAEISGGDAVAMANMLSPEKLADMARKQTMISAKADFVPLRAVDYELNKTVQEAVGSGTKGIHIEASPGKRPRVFLNLDKLASGDVAGHEIGHAIFMSDIMGGEIKQGMRAMVDVEYGAEGLAARGREYAAAMLTQEVNQGATGIKLEVLTPEEVNRKAAGVSEADLIRDRWSNDSAWRDSAINDRIDLMNQERIARGGQPLDWARDEIAAETFSGLGKGVNLNGLRASGPLGRAVGAAQTALDMMGARFRGNGRLESPNKLFTENPLFDSPQMRKAVNDYVKIYDRYLVGLEKEGKVNQRGTPIAPTGRASDAARSPHTRLYPNKGVVESDLFVQRPDGTLELKSQQMVNTQDKARAATLKSINSRDRLVPENSQEWGARRLSNGRVVVGGPTLPPQFDFFLQMPEWLRFKAREFEAGRNEGRSYLYSYNAIGTGADGSYKVKNLGNVEAKTGEAVPFGWDLSQKNHLLAKVIDLNSFRASSMRAIDNQLLGEFGNDLKAVEAGLKQLLKNYQDGVPGETNLGVTKKNILNGLLGTGTPTQRANNPAWHTLNNQGSIRTFRFDRLNYADPYGTGYFPHYDKLNINALPDDAGRMSVDDYMGFDADRQTAWLNNRARKRGHSNSTNWANSDEAGFAAASEEYRKLFPRTRGQAMPDSARPERADIPLNPRARQAAFISDRGEVRATGRATHFETNEDLGPDFLAIGAGHLGEDGFFRFGSQSMDEAMGDSPATSSAAAARYNQSVYDQGRRPSSMLEEPPGLERPTARGQAMPDVDPIEDSSRKIHSVYDKSLLAKDRDTALYPKNPVPDSVVLPPRYGLVGNAPGMPRNFTEVRELVKLLADRVEDTGRRDVPFAQKSARFYSDMANEAVSLAEIVDPQSTGTARFDRADEMLRYLALGSQRTNVPVNSTKSAGAAASVVGDFTAGYKMGFGEAQRATRQAQADFKAGKHFNLDTKGVQDKVRTFYINGLSELIEVARKAGDTAAVEMLEARAAKSLKLVDPNAPKLTSQQLAETERILAGKATIDMWDMAAKRVAVPGFILDPKKRVDLKQPFEWTQKTKAAKDTIGSPRWSKVAKELGIDSPAELRYQQARSLGIEGNFDWTAETWKTRVDSGAPFAGGDFTTYTGSTDAGLSPGGGGRLYDAQQAIDGLLADELNRRGLASMFGKDKLFARNAQEILWAIEKKDNPILANNDLSLFGDSIQPLKQELDAIADKGGQRNVRGAQVLDAMERAYTAMAMQEMPFEVATVGTGRTATAINSALAAMKAAGDPDPLARMTAHYASNLADELTGLATEHGIKLQVDSVKTDLGGFTMDDGSYTETPQITAVIRGNTGDTKYLMQVVNEAVEQQGGNLFRRPSVKELYDPAVEKQPVVSFETSQLTTAQRTAFVTDLAKIRDSKGDRIFTGYTPSDGGVFIGGQFYNGDFAVAVDGHDAAIRSAMKKHGVSVMSVEDMVVPSYRSSDAVAPSAFRDAVQKLFYDKAVSGVAADAPTSILQPANVATNLQSRLKKNEAMFAGRDNLDALAKAINESGSMSADQALARVGQTMEIPGTKKMQAAFSDYVRGNRKKYDALPAADRKAVSEYIKQARESAKALRDQEATFSRAAKEGIRKRRSEIADRYDPQRALDEIDAASLLGYMGDLETVP
jgi:hypothetical protein